MIETKRWIARITYKVLNQPTKNVIVVPASDFQTARRVIEEKYNDNGMQLIEIVSLREINKD